MVDPAYAARRENYKDHWMNSLPAPCAVEYFLTKIAAYDKDFHDPQS